MVVCWFAGLTTLDVVHRAVVPPTRNEKVTATRQDVAAGGPAANAAVTAAALGARAVLVTALGQGPVAAAARADLEAHGVEILDTAAPGFALAVSAVLVDDATGDRSVVSPDGALAVAPAPTPDALAALPRPDAVLLDGHHPSIARAVLAHVTTTPPRPRVVLDAGRWRPVFEDLVPQADVAALSADFRIPTHSDTRVAEAALAMGATAVVITHGPRPIEWHTRHHATTHHQEAPDPQTDTTDTTERPSTPPDAADGTERRNAPADATETTERRDRRRTRGPISPEVERPLGRVNGTARTTSVPPRTQPTLAPGDAALRTQPALAPGDAALRTQPALAPGDVALRTQPALAPGDVALRTQPALAPDEAKDETTGYVTVPPVQARDTLGAGDAFHGALTVALAEGEDLPAATARAARVASTRVTQVGPRAWLGLVS
ncbi:PfkB family carbohydrate kinase [Xylanimonas protaetiae]|uniref:Carbohydrate kinase PfkB domain-containing protein n=1 Tax=Xylanimonas protaetiae TaxID=2509457 RepID=A0A4P6F2Y4_9MICO|nr:PfkB family carbohydrate kinase [Xylanimonas protaetiae]QAY69874.1 hypothetical protein ET471_07365 [Xylanimonas protaetiae]